MIENEVTRLADDQFETYFYEKIWEMIPPFYRNEDGLAENPGVLRSFVEIIAKQAAVLRRSQDRLWEDQFIELCNQWAIPYIADLLNTRMVSALNERAQRADVANTIYQRRRSGTLLILEQLISRITDWEGTVVESFLRLARTRHGLDPKISDLRGQFSSTPPGGSANIRSPRISELVDGPFDEFYHTPDFRKPRGKDGKYGINKLVFHLYRLKSYHIIESDPFPRPGHPQHNGLRFTFDPSGRAIPLFMPRNRPDDLEDWDQWIKAREWSLPAPIPCRLLGHAEYRIRESAIRELQEPEFGLLPVAAGELRKLIPYHFKTERRFKETLASLDNAAAFETLILPILERMLIEDCGKAAILPEAISVDAGPPEEIIATSGTIAGNLFQAIPTIPDEKRLVIDSENGIFTFSGDPVASPVVSYYYGFSGEVGAGGYQRHHVDEFEPDSEFSNGNPVVSADVPNQGIVQINDSKTYPFTVVKLSIVNLNIYAKNQERPYLLLTQNWVLNTGGNTESIINLDGLWIGAAVPGRALILRGDYECVTISHCTFEPGGDEDIFEDTIHPVEFIIEAQIDQLIINSSITGPIRVQGIGNVESLVICDSVIQSVDDTVLAIEQNLGETRIDRATVFGAVEIHRLFASETLITGHAEVKDTQQGCFRFSVAPSGSRLPRPYPYPPIPFTQSGHWFTSRKYGHPGYAQLSKTAPHELRRGAENGSEIGVFSSLINSIKEDSLRIKVSEFMPFGLLPILIYET